MKYRVIGQNRDTGARMSLEFSAESKAAAERKAIAQGMSVNRVEDITDGYVGTSSDPNPAAGNRVRRSGGHRIVGWVILLIAAYLLWMYHSSLTHLIGHGH